MTTQETTSSADGEIPSGESEPLVPADDALGNVKNPTEDRGGDPSSEGSAPQVAGKFLEHFMKLTPCWDLHVHAGDLPNHRIRGRVCFICDLALRLIAASLILLLIGAGVYKALTPFAPLWK